MNRLARMIALPLLGIGALILAKGNSPDMSGKKQVLTEYDNYHLIAQLPSGLYERYERIGYDGVKYCMQILDKGDLKIFDGVGSHISSIESGCDGIIDATSIEKGDLWDLYDYYSAGEESDFWSVYCRNKKDTPEIAKCTERENAFDDNDISDVVSAWDSFRDSCDQKLCYKTLEVTIR